MASRPEKAAGLRPWGQLRAGHPGREQHPDSRLLEEAATALAWWADQRPPRPTSTLSGGGAVAAVEELLSDQLGGRAVLALPNATFALLVALRCSGVGPGDEVIVPAVDWPAARAAAATLGARALAAPVVGDDLTVDPEDVLGLVTPATRAVVACHPHGLMADVAGLRGALAERVALVEDCAQALGASRSGRLAGSTGDYSVFSLGPGKAASAGELGLLVSATSELHRRAVGSSQHPLRQLLAGIAHPAADTLAGRPAPLAAILGAYKLSRWKSDAAALRDAEQTLRCALARHPAGCLARRLGHADQQPQPGRVPVLMSPGAVPGQLERALRAELPGRFRPRVAPSGLCVDPAVPDARRRVLAKLLAGVRVVTVETGDGGHPGDEPPRSLS